MVDTTFDPTKDSWGKGEPIPAGMPSADAGVSTTPSSPTNAPSPAAMPSVGGSDDLKSITAGLADIERAKINAETRAYGGIEGQMGKDLKAVEEARKNAGVEPGTLKPWNEKMEAAKYETDPIAAFGSIGSVMGILASAFTHEPLVNAMSASAAAINAIKQGDKDAYNHAYKAWEANTKLALEKHKIQHEQFEDAITLLKTNMAAGEAKARLLAAKFGDQKSLFLLENGMDKDLIELQTARQTAALKMEQMLPKIQENNAIISGLFAKGYDPKHPTSPESQKALHDWQMEQAQIKHMGSALGGGILTPGRQQAAAIQERMQEIKAKHPEMPDSDAYTQAAQEIKTQTATPTGNRLDELKGKENQVDNALHITDEIDQMLLRHKFITGLGGNLTRPPEIIANILGSNETDREQFKRLVQEMRLMAPRILLDTRGRPISAEAERVNDIIAGLSPGDTGPNTIRAYVELRDQLNRIKGQLKERQGPAAPSHEEAPVAPKAEKGWDAYPTVH